jgi:hypothetical protein
MLLRLALPPDKLRWVRKQFYIVTSLKLINFKQDL